MFGLGKKQVHRIGIDIGRDGLRLAQLSHVGRDVSLVAGQVELRPQDIEPGSARWQRWAVDVLKQAVHRGGFRGRAVNAVIPASDMAIGHIRVPKHGEQMNEEYIYTRLKSKIAWRTPRNATMVQVVAGDKEHAVVMAAERELINRHLAVYEKAGVEVKALGVWPDALVRCYVNFFGRRQSDLTAVVMLVNVEGSSTNVVICRHSALLFARSIPLGADSLTDEASTNRLVLEVAACRRDYAATYKHGPVSRLIFMSGPVVDTDIYAAIAKQVEVPAQIGDCLVAVEMPEPLGELLERRDQHISWATAFGLSLS